MIPRQIRNRGPKRTVRGYAERIPGAQKFRLICPAGHVQIAPFDDRFPGRVWDEAIIEKFSRYWSKEHAGVSFHCRKCFPRG